eukprot:4357030-Pleurochrysis_carterae.AAC.1
MIWLRWHSGMQCYAEGATYYGRGLCCLTPLAAYLALYPLPSYAEAFSCATMPKAVSVVTEGRHRSSISELRKSPCAQNTSYDNLRRRLAELRGYVTDAASSMSLHERLIAMFTLKGSACFPFEMRKKFLEMNFCLRLTGCQSAIASTDAAPPRVQRVYHSSERCIVYGARNAAPRKRKGPSVETASACNAPTESKQLRKLAYKFGHVVQPVASFAKHFNDLMASRLKMREGGARPFTNLRDAIWPTF